MSPFGVEVGDCLVFMCDALIPIAVVPLAFACSVVWLEDVPVGSCFLLSNEHAVLLCRSRSFHRPQTTAV